MDTKGTTNKIDHQMWLCNCGNENCNGEKDCTNCGFEFPNRADNLEWVTKSENDAKYTFTDHLTRQITNSIIEVKKPVKITPQAEKVRKAIVKLGLCSLSQIRKKVRIEKSSLSRCLLELRTKDVVKVTNFGERQVMLYEVI